MDSHWLLVIGSVAVVGLLFSIGYAIARRGKEESPRSSLSKHPPLRRVVMFGVLTLGLVLGMLFGNAVPQSAFGAWLRRVGPEMYLLMLASGYVVLSGIIEALVKYKGLKGDV